MASDTKATEIKRARTASKMGRRRKNREAKKSTRSWNELFEDAPAQARK